MKITIGGAGAAGSSPSTGNTGAAAPTQATEVGGVDSSGNLRAISTDSSGNQNVNVVQSALPAGAATAAKQDTGNGSLATIATNTPAVGQKAMAGSSPVTIASDQSAVPVSGTVAVSNQPTTIAVTQATGTNLHAVIDSSALPTGAATSAKQPALGTAGTPSADVLTVQGNASGTPLPVSGTVTVSNQPTTVTVTQSTAANLNATVTGTVAANQSGTWTIQPGNTQNTTAWLTQDASNGSVAAGTAAVKSSLAGGQFNTTLPTLTTGQQAAIQLDASGRQILGTSTASIGAVTIGNGTSTNVVGTVYQIGGTTGSSPGSASASSTATTLTAPSNAQGFTLQNQDTVNGGILRWRVGATATASLGQRLLPGESSNWIPSAASISVIAESGTPLYDVQWIVR